MSRTYPERAWTRFLHLVGFGKTTAVTNEGGAVSTVQLRMSALQLRDNTTHLQHFGFASSPPIGSDTVHLNLGGDPGQTVIIATGHQTYRLKNLGQGQAALYDQFGHTVILSSTGIAILGDVAVTGNMTVTGEITAGFGGADSVTLQQHQHLNTQPGSGTSGIPKAGT